MSKAPKRPVLDNPTETTFTAEWEPVEGAKGYKVFVREYPKEWSTAEVIEVKGNKAETTLVENRFPTSTYQVRVVAIFEDGTESPPSEEATVDTAVANCAPEKKNKCAIS